MGVGQLEVDGLAGDLDLDLGVGEATVLAPQDAVKAVSVNVGIGDATTAEVRVTFPGAEPGPWQTVQADAFWLIDRDSAAPQQWRPN